MRRTRSTTRRQSARGRRATLLIVALAVATTAGAAGESATPQPGEWRSVATLGAIGISQQHTGVLGVSQCASDLVFQVPGKPTLHLTRTPDGDAYLGTTRTDGCTTHWRLEPGTTRMTGGYRGQCPGGALSAKVVMTRVGPAESAPQPADTRSGTATPPESVPDDWMPETGDQDRLSLTSAVDAVEDAILESAGASPRSDALNGYVWPKVEDGSTRILMWLTADHAPRLHHDLLPEPCDAAPGSLEPANYLLSIKVLRPDYRDYMVFAQLIDVTTGKILRQTESAGGADDAGMQAAIDTAYDKLGLNIPLPR